jgi:hypothetical protein
MSGKAFSANLLAKVKNRAQYENIVGASDTGISWREVCRFWLPKSGANVRIPT